MRDEDGDWLEDEQGNLMAGETGEETQDAVMSLASSLLWGFNETITQWFQEHKPEELHQVPLEKAEIFLMDDVYSAESILTEGLDPEDEWSEPWQ